MAHFALTIICTWVASDLQFNNTQLVGQSLHFTFAECACSKPKFATDTFAARITVCDISRQIAEVGTVLCSLDFEPAPVLRGQVILKRNG